MSIKIKVNGKWIEIAEPTRVADLLGVLGVADPRSVAIALDEEVIPKSQWETTSVRDGQSVEVVRAVQGG